MKPYTMMAYHALAAMSFGIWQGSILATVFMSCLIGLGLLVYDAYKV